MNSDFPYLDETMSFQFPSVDKSTPEGIVAVGGNLSPGMLLSAYRQGIFPWYANDDPILWWSPDPRCVILPQDLHVSKSMRKILKHDILRVSLDTCFSEVVASCQTIPRKNQGGTWITEEMREAYKKLHDLGFAHSIEVWDGKMLVGGLYGLSLGHCFFGESMFSRVSNASKVALIRLMEILIELEFELFDCQIYSPHLDTIGATQITRDEFLRRLKKSLRAETVRGSWTGFLHK